MRVTKVIREYVEREIRNKFDKKIEDARREYDEEKKELSRRLEELVNETEEKAYGIAKAMGFDYNYVGRRSVNISPSSFRNKEKDDAVYGVIDELRQKERRAIEDILLSLELGETTKSELKDAIDAVEV